MTDCGNWAVTATWNVPTTAVSGVYYAVLHRNDTGGENEMAFVIRNDSSHSDVLFQTSDETWEAYNSYGGNSLYTGYRPRHERRVLRGQLQPAAVGRGRRELHLQRRSAHGLLHGAERATTSATPPTSTRPGAAT